MKEELNENIEKVVKAQREENTNGIIVHTLHKKFKETIWAEKEKEAKTKEEKETMAHNKEKDLKPLEEQIEIKKRYIKWLGSSDMDSAVQESLKDI